MLLEIDRFQLAVPDAPLVAKKWQSILGAELLNMDAVSCLGATRTTLRVGTGLVELLEADGSGVVQNAIARRGAHMFAAGASTEDVPRIKHHLESQGYTNEEDGGQLYIVGEDVGIAGLRLVISKHETREAVGDIDYLYEATVLAGESEEATARFAEVFALDAQEFVSIDSRRFGYSGTLTLFQQKLLHRFEVITPLEADKTMGRFFNKVGACLYMGFAETTNMLEIEQRVLERGEGFTVDRPEDRDDNLPANQVWLHPATLGGMMLGLSRPSMAWQWSGHPEWVEEI